jgi:phosphoglycolate phosphatase
MASGVERAHLVQAYKDAFNQLRGPDGQAELSPLFPGALDALDVLRRQDHTLLAVATGKSRRGLDKMLGMLNITVKTIIDVCCGRFSVVVDTP